MLRLHLSSQHSHQTHARTIAHHRPAKRTLLIGLALTVSLLCQSILTLPSAHADAITPHVTDYTLPTGQHLIIKEDHSRPIVTIDTWVKTGSVNETPAINGVSHFLEHLLFKGTEKYKAGQIDRLLEDRGSEFNAATSDDFTHFYITTATPYFEEALKLHADMMVNAAIPPDELKQERKVVQEEINRANDNPDRLLYIELSKLIYGHHGYAFDTLGPKENIATIPRDSILAYYHNWYQPRNFNTVIVGDVQPEAVKKLVESAFPKPPFLPPSGYQAPTIGPVIPPQAPQVKIIENPNISQVYLALGLLGPAQQNPDDVYALDIATLVLGSGKSSRLYEALKEKQSLVNDVSAGNYTQKYSGLVVVDAEAKPENREQVKKELLQQLEILRTKGITQAELDKAKTQYLKDFIFENETTDGTASSIGYNVTIGSLDDYRTHVANVEKVTREQVQSALNRYLDLNQAVLVELLPTSLHADTAQETHDTLALLSQTASSIAATAKTQESQSSISDRPTGVDTTAPDKAAIAPTRTVLSNGITLISQPLKDSSTVAIKIFIKGGEGVENKAGEATLMASTMMQGTRSRTAEAISNELESRGMSLTVSADDDYIEVTGNAIQEDFGELFNILQDVMTGPTFTNAEISKKKVQIRQAIIANRDNPSSVTFENLSLGLYPHHPYGDEGKRIEAALGGITRADLLNYYRTYFVPQNMIVSLVGNFDPQTAVNDLTALYPPSPKGASHQPVKIEPVPALLKSATVMEEKPSLSAVWMAQGWLTPPIRDQKDYAALKVLNSLIGTGMSSRLFVDLREKQGLAYVVGSMYPSRDQKSRFVMYIGTDPVNTDKVKAGFQDEIKRIQEEKVPEVELNEAKSKLIGSFALAHDTNVNQAYYLGLYETLGVGYRFDSTYPDLVNTVTANDVQRVAKTYLGGPSVFSIIKPSQTPVNNKEKLAPTPQKSGHPLQKPGKSGKAHSGKPTH